VDRDARVNTGWIPPSELQFDVRAEDLTASSAAPISILGTQNLIQVTRIGHREASFSSNRYPAPAILSGAYPRDDRVLVSIAAHVVPGFVQHFTGVLAGRPRETAAAFEPSWSGSGDDGGVARVR
jgi:hypothetical protein